MAFVSPSTCWSRPLPKCRGGVRCTSSQRRPRPPTGPGRPGTAPASGQSPRHGRSSNGWRARARGIGCRHRVGSALAREIGLGPSPAVQRLPALHAPAQSAARFRSARRSTPAGRGHQLREWFPRDRRLRACGTPGSRTRASRAGNDCDACSLAMSKGQNSAKRDALALWVKAVNAKGGFGRWCWDVAFKPAEIQDILSRHTHHGDRPEPPIPAPERSTIDS